MMRRFGRYEVLHKLGQGAMSAVYLARDPMLSRLAAIKVLHPDLLYQPAVLARFFKEAKAVSRINCPYVVQVLDIGMEGRVPFMVLEFIDGHTLQKVMDQLGGEPIPADVAASMMLQVAEGLCSTAALGIVHRDLKPDNLMLGRRGMVKVTDFGICHLKDHTMTATGQILGSPRFMSPEQVKGLKPLTAQSDLFSFGAVFYFLLTGVPPFQADTQPDLYRQITEGRHIPIQEMKPGLDRNLGRLVDSLLEKDPSKRGQGPAQVALALRKYLHRRKVLDPVDRVSEYIQELTDSDVHTTSNLTPEQVKMWLGSIDLRKPDRRIPVWKFVTASAGAALAAGLAIIGTIHWQSRAKAPSMVPGQQESIRAAVSGPTSTVTSSPAREEKSEAGVLSGPGQSEVTDRPPATSKPDGHVNALEIPPAILTIQSSPPFAEVRIDGEDLGRTPLEGKPIPAGLHRLSLKSRVGRTLDTSITLNEGPQTLKFVLLENPAIAGHEEAGQ